MTSDPINPDDLPSVEAILAALAEQERQASATAGVFAASPMVDEVGEAAHHVVDTLTAKRERSAPAITAAYGRLAKARRHCGHWCRSMSSRSTPCVMSSSCGPGRGGRMAG